jgi:hypothetical protein
MTRASRLVLLCALGLLIGHLAGVRVAKAFQGCTAGCVSFDGDPYGAESSHTCLGLQQSCSCGDLCGSPTPIPGYCRQNKCKYILSAMPRFVWLLEEDG